MMRGLYADHQTPSYTSLLQDLGWLITWTSNNVALLAVMS